MSVTFDLHRFASLIGKPVPYKGRYWNTYSIIGPYDALQLTHTRELIRPYVKFGEPVWHDLFILAAGEPPTRSCTKLGGIPCFGEHCEWPRGTDGALLPFLAQFNFDESTDLVGDLPGDILLVFAFPDFRTGIEIRWTKLIDHTSLIEPEAITAPCLRPFHGHRWRVHSYPQGEPVQDEDWSGIMISDYEEVLQPYNVLCPLGLQIGRHPSLPPTGIGLSRGEQVLCSLTSVHPTLNRPYPFLNHPHELRDDNVQDYCIHVGEYDSGEINCGQLVVVDNGNNGFRAIIAYH